MKQILVDENLDDIIANDAVENDNIVVRKDTNLQKCSNCEKVTNSLTGLKIHITKMHQNIERKTLFSDDEIKGDKQNRLNSVVPMDVDLEEASQEKVSQFCDNIFESPGSLKEHCKNKHEKSDDSTSPPLKKQKCVKDTTVVDMDIEENHENVVKKNNKEDNKLKKNVKESLRRPVKKIEDKTGSDLTFSKKIKPIPDECKELLNSDDVIFQVKPDGCCGPNCAAVFLFNDESLGPQLRLKMNKFMAKHWIPRYQHIANCSKETPFVRRLNGGKVSFTEPKNLLEFLKRSSDAAYMWTDSEDLTIIADMYQIKIKIVTVKRLEGREPTVNWIYPDEKLAEHAELKNVDLGTLVLVHTDDYHFDLVVSKDSIIAQPDSGDLKDNVFTTEEENKDKEIKRLKKRNQLLESEYNLCENELRKKTEETEKLKSEVANLTKMLTVLKEAQEVSEQKENIAKVMIEKSVAQHRKNDEDTDEILLAEEFNCDNCDFQGMSDPELKNHMTVKHSMETFNCPNCCVKFKTSHDIENHICESRNIKEKNRLMKIKCRNCDEEFNSKPDLMIHRKVNHLELVAVCRKKAEGKCIYTDASCWWKHEPINDTKIECYYCDSEFVSKSDLMKHRKDNHVKTVKPCRQFLTGSCRFSDELCWFRHGMSGFRQGQLKEKPPVEQ